MSDSTNTFISIEQSAHESAFGCNPLPIPTDAQCLAGNYKVGRTVIYGLPVAIEQPRHSYRTGIDQKTGTRWTSRLAAHYGYFQKTRGADGDPVDCFIGFYPQSEYAWVINQYVAGKFDEHKTMLCFPDEETARRAYLDSYDKGWNGLHSMIKVSIDQLKWWLKNGNHKNPLKPEHLPYEGIETMSQRITWDSTQNPEQMSLDKVLYEIRRADAGDNLVLDAVTMADILAEADEIMALDALTSPYSKLKRKMEVLQAVMDRAGGAVKTVAMQLSDPFKQNGVAQVAAVFELSDGQTISIFFHNPDVTPAKIAPTDELISWKWLLNKKDITIVVAPERGQDLNVKAVAERIIKLAEKNSAAFQRANVKRTENLAAIESLKAEIPVLEKELSDAQHELEVAKIEADDKAAEDRFNEKLASIDFGQKILKSLIDIFGWKNQSIGETLSRVTKDIGGGVKGGVVNPNGIRRLAAWVNDSTLSATFGDSTLVEVDLNKSETPEENAKRLDDAVNAEDPRYVAPTQIDWSKARELDTDAKVQALGIARIDEIGSENVYIEKDGQPYYMKPPGTGKYSVGEYDFSNEVVFGDDTGKIGDPTSPEGYAKIKGIANMELRYQDVLDSFFQSRIAAVWRALKAIGWEGTEKSYDSTKNGFLAKFNFKNVGAGANVVGYWVEVKDGADIQAEIGDNLTGTPADVAAQIDAVVTNSGTVTKDNYPPESDAVIELTGNELGDFPDTEEGKKARREATRDYLESKLRGKWILCKSINTEIEIRQRGIDESIYWSASPKKLKALAVIDKIIEGAHSPDYQANLKPDKKPQVIEYIHLKNKVSIDGEITPFEVIVERDADGHLHYDIMISKDEVTAALDSSSAAAAWRTTPDTKSGIRHDSSLEQNHEKVNQEIALDAASNGQWILNLFIDGESPEYIPDDESNQSQPNIDTLQSIVDGNSDGEDLDTLLDKIDAAASALEAAGLAEQYDELIGKAATKWAELDQKANG